MIYFLLMIYVFTISILIEKKQPKPKIIRVSGPKKKHKFAFSADGIWAFLILLPMGYMAMMRSYEVGSDTNGIYRLIYYGGYAVDDWKPTIYEGAFIQYVKLVYRFFSGFDSLLLISFLVLNLNYFLLLLFRIHMCFLLLVLIYYNCLHYVQKSCFLHIL